MLQYLVASSKLSAPPPPTYVERFSVEDRGGHGRLAGKHPSAGGHWRISPDSRQDP
jgi:hypothetical protein